MIMIIYELLKCLHKNKVWCGVESTLHKIIILVHKDMISGFSILAAV